VTVRPRVAETSCQLLYPRTTREYLHKYRIDLPTKIVEDRARRRKPGNQRHNKQNSKHQQIDDGIARNGTGINIVRQWGRNRLFDIERFADNDYQQNERSQKYDSTKGSSPSNG